jgi:phenylacetate-CoA ligase
LRHSRPLLRIVPEPDASPDTVRQKVEAAWPGAFEIVFVGTEDLVRLGERAKFRHVVTA